MSKLFVILLLLFPSTATVLTSDYTWPLPYGKELTSIFGDWRSRHYHAGIDIRTGGRIGMPVVAPADGYLMRVRTSYYGYGKALYLKMKDGNIALFGHLERFCPEVEYYVRKHQVEIESYKQNLFPEKNMFRYTRGDTIAWSGATGVGAPHLHFEIRSPDNHPLNPLSLPGLQLQDSRPPVFKKFILVGNYNQELVRALGYQTEFKLSKSKQSKTYQSSQRLLCNCKPFWLSVEVSDKVGISNWKKSVYSIELRQGKQTLYWQSFDSLDFMTFHKIVGERNFQMAMQGKKYFYNLVPADLPTDHGICELLESDTLPLEIIATDISGNSSRAIVEVESGRSNSTAKSQMQPDYSRLRKLIEDYGGRYDDIFAAFIPDYDTLYLLLQTLDQQQSLFEYTAGGTGSIERFFDLGNGFYLAPVIACSQGDHLIVEDSIQIRRLTLSGSEMIYKLKSDCYAVSVCNDPDENFTITSNDGRFKAIMSPVEDTFFPLDRKYFFRLNILKTRGKTIYQVTPDNLAVRKQLTFKYTFKDAGTIPHGAGLYRVADNGKISFLGNDVDSVTNSVVTQSYQLGSFCMVIDTVAPSIRNIKPQHNSQVFTPRPMVKATLKDTLSGIGDDIEIRIDGKWCVPLYDPDKHLVTSELHFDLVPGKHRLDIVVTDRCGNERHYKGSFTFVNRKRK